MQRRHRLAHARIWTVLAILLPLILFAAMAIRQVGPVEGPSVPVKLEAAESPDS